MSRYDHAEHTSPNSHSTAIPHPAAKKHMEANLAPESLSGNGCTEGRLHLHRGCNFSPIHMVGQLIEKATFSKQASIMVPPQGQTHA